MGICWKKFKILPVNYRHVREL